MTNQPQTELIKSLKFDNPLAKVVWSEENGAWLYTEGTGFIGQIPPNLLDAILAHQEKAVLKAKQGAFNKFATTFNNYASEHRDVVSTEAVGVVWGILAQQQIPVEDRIAELTSKESE